MRSPPEDSGNVKKFSYKRSNSNTIDGQTSDKKSYSPPVDNASKSILGSSDMDVIWSVRKDCNPIIKDKFTALSPPLMKGFYSRYTSQDPRFKSLLENRDKDSDFGQHGGLNQHYCRENKSTYSYSQERGKQQGYSEPSTTFNSQPLSQVTTQNKRSQQEYSGKNPHSNQNAGNFDSPSPTTTKERHSSNSWDDFF